MHGATPMLYQYALGCSQQRQVTLYRGALQRGRRGQLWSGLTGRSRRLLFLEEVSRAGRVQARSSGGTRTVAIAEICGSENRAADFDCDFNPLQDHTQDRWLGIASALQRGRHLPPVALIQVGDHYFVRDGHHRISVVRALGQNAIEATVEVWQVDTPLCWEQLSQAPRRSHARGHGERQALGNGSPRASILAWLAAVLRPPHRAGANQTAR